jgi:hypothetical protein
LTGEDVTCCADLLRFVIMSNSSKSDPGVRPPRALLVCRGAGNYKKKF